MSGDSTSKLVNQNEAFVPVMLLLPTGTPVRHVGRATIPFDRSRQVESEISEILDGPYKGYLVAVPRGCVVPGS
jgi:hypothetical protein